MRCSRDHCGLWKSWNGASFILKLQNTGVSIAPISGVEGSSTEVIYSHSSEHRVATNEQSRTFPFQNRQGVTLNFMRAKVRGVTLRTRCCGIFLVGLLLIFAATSQAAVPSNPRKVIIDTDPGTDDAIAILLAL